MTHERCPSAHDTHYYCPDCGAALVIDWRTLRPGARVRVLEPLIGDESGVVTRIEPSLASDSAWVYVENGGVIEERVLLIDCHPPRLELLAWAPREERAS